MWVKLITGGVNINDTGLGSIVSTAFFNIILPLFILSVLILIHELGHFIAAIKCGVGVKEFALGMGPKIFSITRKKIDFSIRAFPIGGFVSMIGEDENSDNENALNKKPIWKRFIVNIAGATMNIVLGFVIMAIYLSGATAFPTTTISSFNENSQTSNAGLRIGDKIIKIDNKRTNIANDLSFTLLRKADTPVDITVMRDNKKEVIRNVRFPVIEEDGIKFGVSDFRVEYEKKNIGTLLKNSYLYSVSMIDMVWSSLYDLVTGKYGMKAVSGPVGVTQEIGKSAKEGMPSFLFLIALITINMGVVNLLPIPAMDGGRLVFLFIEFIRRKPIKPEYEGYVHLAGLLVLFLFMILITFNDIQNYFIH